MKTKPDLFKSEYAVCVLDQNGVSVFEENAHIPMEAASTVKCAIVYRTLEILKNEHNTNLELQFTRHLRHRSYGSGVVNWTLWRKFSAADLIYLCLNFSDCVATNILLEFIGGQKSLNEWLHNTGYVHTQLHTKKIYTNRKHQFRKLCTSTAYEMSGIAYQLMGTKWSFQADKLLEQSLSNQHIGWIKPYFKRHTANVYFKTGSIIQDDTLLPFVYDAAGRYSGPKTTQYFCLLSRFTPTNAKIDVALLQAAQKSAFQMLEHGLPSKKSSL